MADLDVDCIVIGAGVVGLACGAAVAETGREVVVVERHDLIGSETSSRNSEVIHAGIYYPTGSVKAQTCVEGKELLYEYCAGRGVPHKRCGKVIVATADDQIETIEAYREQAFRNGVDDLTWLKADEVSELEPAVTSMGGVFSPSTGIIDSHAFMLSLQGDLERHGGQLALLTEVLSVRQTAGGPEIQFADYTMGCEVLINSAGLEAPLFAADMPGTPEPCYAKGHYYSYSGKQPFSHLVYPVAEAGGLGVHVTMDLAGQAKFGPDVRWIDDIDYTFDDSRFDDFVTAIRAYYPDVDPSRLQPGYTGIRPKLSREGRFEDFRIEGPADHGFRGRINLLGIESPGLTASLAIAKRVRGLLGST